MRRALVCALLAVLLTGCGRSANDGGEPTATLPDTTPLASEIAASIADTTPETFAPSPTLETTEVEEGASSAAAPARIADLESGEVEQTAGTLTVHITLAEPVDAAALGEEEQAVVGAYLLADEDDLEPFAARVLVEPGRQPRFLFGPWLEAGKPIDGTLDGTELTLTVPGLDQGRFRYAQFFAEDPLGGETLPEGANGLVAINAAQ